LYTTKEKNVRRKIIQMQIRPCEVEVVSHHVLVLVHWSSVLGLALWLRRIFHGFKTRLPFSVVITDITLLGISS
jgi:hypothetical protein